MSVEFSPEIILYDLMELSICQSMLTLSLKVVHKMYSLHLNLLICKQINFVTQYLGENNFFLPYVQTFVTFIL
jgi:hypothetical protein